MTLTESYVAGPTAPAVRDITLGQLLEQAARSAPERLALIAGVPDPALRRQWTYSELYTEAQRTARALLHRFKPGERIAVWAQNLPEWIMLEFGAGLAGVVLVTVNPASGPTNGICAEAIPLGRRVRRHRLPRQSDAGDGTRGCPALR
jgi:fatty-acyl-CoA synthase